MSETRRLPAAAASEGDGGASWRWRGVEGLPAGCRLAAVVTMAAVAVGGTRHPGVAAAGLAFAMFVAGRRMSLPVALASGVIGWLFFDGFIVGRHGDLVWGTGLSRHGGCWCWWLLRGAVPRSPVRGITVNI